MQRAHVIKHLTQIVVIHKGIYTTIGLVDQDPNPRSRRNFSTKLDTHFRIITKVVYIFYVKLDTHIRNTFLKAGLILYIFYSE